MPNGSPDLDLTVPQQAAPSPVQTVGALANLRGLQSEIALRNQQMQTSAAQQQDIQAQAAGRAADVADQNTIQQKMLDSAFAHSVSSWNGSGPFPLDGIVQPKTATAYKTAVQTAQKSQIGLTTDQRASFDAAHAHVATSLNGLLYKADGTPQDDTFIAANAPTMISELMKDGFITPETAQQVNITNFKDGQNYASQNGFLQGLNDYATKNAGAAQKILTDAAAAAKDTGAAAESNATAAKMNALMPGEVAAQATTNDQAARKLAGTSATGITGEEQITNKNLAGELAVKQAEEKIKRDTFQATLGSGLDANGQPITPEALKASALLDPTAKAIADYQLAPPPATTRGGMPTPLYRKVLAINPDYDGTQFAARSKVQQGFSASGPQGQAITSADTALSHLNSISLAGQALKSGDVQQLNRLANFVGAQTGSAAPAVYDSIVATVAPEISKAVIGAAGGEGDRAQMAANFSRNQSDAQREGAVAANVGLLSARVQKQADAYAASMGHPLARQLSPESQAVIQRYGGVKATAGAPAFKVGDPVMYGGKQHTVTAINADGKLVLSQ